MSRTKADAGAGEDDGLDTYLVDFLDYLQLNLNHPPNTVAAYESDCDQFLDHLRAFHGAARQWRYRSAKGLYQNCSWGSS